MSNQRKKVEVFIMFGIGLPEFILILALALIVVGPDKLPDLARSVAKGILDLKKTANTLKESLTEDGNPLDEIKPELEKAAKALKDDLLDNDDDTWTTKDREKIYDPKKLPDEDSSAIIDVEPGKASETTADQDLPKPALEEDKDPEVDDSKTKEINKIRTTSEPQSQHPTDKR
ncbi:MAG: twin-arginine translocase TatA/TatE family subunit [Thermodesulfobacteriota bacterium]|nr:twin-arginine translocase TatA/TatE family subunit [Thermodesulfobacteriota bacterium]